MEFCMKPDLFYIPSSCVWSINSYVHNYKHGGGANIWDFFYLQYLWFIYRRFLLGYIDSTGWLQILKHMEFIC
jgi:hypothetical protein